MDPVALRLEELERRVRALEAALPNAASLLGPLPEAPRRAPTLARERPTPPLQAGDAPATPSAAGQAPRPFVTPHARPTPRPHPRAPGDLERWLGGVLLARVGIGAVVLAAAYFAQLAYRHVPDVFKVLSLYGLAAALLATAHLLRTRAAKRFVGLLQGGAVAVAYVAGLAASLRYGLVSAEVGLVLLAGAAALGTWLARRLAVEALAAVSVVGALTAPALLGLVHAGHALVLALLVGVNAWAGWAERRWAWSATRAVAFAGASLLAIEWFAAARWDALDTLWTMHATLLLLLAPELLGLLRGRGPTRVISVLAGVALGLLLGLHLGLEALRDFGGGSRLEGSGLAAAGGWLALLFALGATGRGRDEAFFVRGLARLAGIGVVLGAAILWDRNGREALVLGALALLAPLLLLLRRRLEVGALGALAAALLAWGVVGDEAEQILHHVPKALSTLHALLLLPLSLVPATALLLAGRRPPAIGAGAAMGGITLLTAFGSLAPASGGWWLAAFGTAGVWFTLVALWARLRGEASAATLATLGITGTAVGWVAAALVALRVPGWVAPWDPYTLCAVSLAVCAFVTRALLQRPGLMVDDGYTTLAAVALGLLVLAGGREVHLLTRGMEGAWAPVLMSVYVTLVAAGLLVLGFARGARGLRLTALLLFAGVVAKIGLHDLAAARLELRVLVTLVLGLTLLASGFAYARTGRREAP